MNNLLNLNSVFKDEADEIFFKKGLLNILNSYWKPHLTGSYDLGLITWRDLDIYLKIVSICETDYFRLGGEICKLLSPIKISFRNEIIEKKMDFNLAYTGEFI